MSNASGGRGANRQMFVPALVSRSAPPGRARCPRPTRGTRTLATGQRVAGSSEPAQEWPVTGSGVSGRRPIGRPMSFAVPVGQHDETS